jgi:hypothetical protein
LLLVLHGALLGALFKDLIPASNAWLFASALHVAAAPSGKRPGPYALVLPDAPELLVSFDEFVHAFVIHIDVHFNE